MTTLDKKEVFKPHRPKKPCARLGCPRLTDGRHCLAHTQTVEKENNARRGSSTTQGYGSRWRAVRAAYLSKHPACVRCLAEGVVTMATAVDHIVPHKGDRTLFWDETNWQPLCKRCHDSKTAKEDGRWRGREFGYDDAGAEPDGVAEK